VAVDTREKRQSATALLVPAFVPGVEPSTLDVAGRQASVWIYSGIVSTIIANVAIFMRYYRNRRMT